MLSQFESVGQCWQTDPQIYSGSNTKMYLSCSSSSKARAFRFFFVVVFLVGKWLSPIRDFHVYWNVC